MFDFGLGWEADSLLEISIGITLLILVLWFADWRKGKYENQK